MLGLIVFTFKLLELTDQQIDKKLKERRKRKRQLEARNNNNDDNGTNSSALFGPQPRIQLVQSNSQPYVVAK
ncbi:unnamed protein product [Ambrosiozyma monospora]|uniref:Unnamed protein product n=1 Tax=Ambrosiozyma monospora TaxID=43982 RepID=A0ACB5TKZ2_AMBMO|nr:unnamed protein product [Ambrosiozyma monospora]